MKVRSGKAKVGIGGGGNDTFIAKARIERKKEWKKGGTTTKEGCQGLRIPLSKTGAGD